MFVVVNGAAAAAVDDDDDDADKDDTDECADDATDNNGADAGRASSPRNKVRENTEADGFGAAAVSAANFARATGAGIGDSSQPLEEDNETSRISTLVLLEPEAVAAPVAEAEAVPAAVAAAESLAAFCCCC